MSSRPATLGALRETGYRDESVKDEMRRNLSERLKNGVRLFPGIVGYDDTVVPQLVNAILARHDIVLLGLRGQAKTRIIRSLVQFLDEYVPIIAGSEVSDHPYHPISRFGTDLVNEAGDETPIEWIPREARYGEKLATPDVTIADLVGDIDPIKAAQERLHYAHEGVIHFGLIPRTNRCIFAMNEVPDLQPRIQVGLLNILEEKDIQIRGFPVRIPMDLQIVFTANPEDYTNRGNLITPLKDRIGSQIITHYPRTLEDGIAITRQEAWADRGNGIQVEVPPIFREIIEATAVEARQSEYIDQKSGVSARMTIAALEALVSNVERRAIITGQSGAVRPRVCDLHSMVAAITGKVELVYEGEQEGDQRVAEGLITRAVKRVFDMHFPAPTTRQKKRSRGSFDLPDDMNVDFDVGHETSPTGLYTDVVSWFEQGNTVLISDRSSDADYRQSLEDVPRLRQIVDTTKHPLAKETGEHALMELVLEGLHAHSQLSKDRLTEGRTMYQDPMNELFGHDDDEDDNF